VKWISHNLTTFAIYYTVSGDIIKSLIASTSSTVPDLVEAVNAGVTLHLIADSLSGSGIPLLGNKRIALKVYKTFTLLEFAVVSFVLISCGISFALVRFLLT